MPIKPSFVEELKAFYPIYLAEHKNVWTRRFHFLGTLGFILLMVFAFITGQYWIALLAPISGYGFAWYSHWKIEKNKPATFKHPLLSLICDCWMFFDVLRGKSLDL